jgi:hypothetical protein
MRLHNYFSMNRYGQYYYQAQMAGESARIKLMAGDVGNALDLTGERTRTNYAVETGKSAATESFEIKVRDHKKEPVEVRVVEHLYRGRTWDAASSSAEYKTTDAHTIEFPVTVAPDGEKTITHTAHYIW